MTMTSSINDTLPSEHCNNFVFFFFSSSSFQIERRCWLHQVPGGANSDHRLKSTSSSSSNSSEPFVGSLLSSFAFALHCTVQSVCRRQVLFFFFLKLYSPSSSPSSSSSCLGPHTILKGIGSTLLAVAMAVAVEPAPT